MNTMLLVITVKNAFVKIALAIKKVPVSHQAVLVIANTVKTTTEINKTEAVMVAFVRTLKLLGAYFLIACSGLQAATLPSFRLPVVNTTQPQEFFDSKENKANLLIEFYFNSCPACNKNAPSIGKIAQEFHSSRTKILEISVDCDASDYASWMKKHPPKGLILNSCDGTIQDELKVTGYPTSFIFDCEGNQLFKHIGVWSESTYNQARQILTNLQFKTCN